MRKKIGYTIAALFIAGVVRPMRADTIFTVTLNTALLTTTPGSSAGPFSLAFQLTDGSGLGDGNNTATLSDFTFGAGGSAGLCPTACTDFGGASGSIGSSVVLSDTGFFNALVDGFTPGSTLSFLVDLTTNVDSGGTPDIFAFSLLDGSGSALPTLDPSGADTLLAVSLDSAHPGILTYATDTSRLTSQGGVSISLSAPVIGVPVSSVPEPDGALFLGVGIGSLIHMARRRGRRAALK